ncbi:MAG TPA: FG-GAP-like repeat-containing protein [Gammaproteobacteria bacterium]|nr:FG-GAP-like repeat-containing protein [Gammaproteobacteria bacterium]
MHTRLILPRYAVGLAALAYCALAQANGLFPTTNYHSLNQPSAVVLADVNGDGKLDAVELGSGTIPSVAVYLGNGDGSFKSPLHYYAVGTGPIALAVADLNHDGKPDIVVVNSSGGNISVLLGNGDGTFQDQTVGQAAAGTGTAAPTYPVGNGAIYVAVADLRGNGIQDLVVANYTDGTVSVLLGRGDGTFKPQTTIPVGGGPDCINVADFNGDGKLDLLVSNSIDGTLSVLLGNGDGTFQAPTTIRVNAHVRVATLQMAVVGDIRNDGKLDVVTTVTNATSSAVVYLPGNGDGTFGAPQFIAAGLETHYLQLADVNGDGNLDLVTGSFAEGTLNVLFGRGDGKFDAPVSYPAPGISSASALQAYAVGDLNGDGKPEIVAVNPTGGFLQVLVNNGSGEYHPPLSVDLGNIPAAVVSADLNGDGHADLVEANSADGTVSVLLGNGDGTFKPAQTYTVGSHPQALKLVDVNGDGKLDILVGNFGDNTVGVLLGNGDGTFQAMRAYPAGSNLVGIDVGDMHQDGKLDVVAANAVVNEVSILRGNGDGTFAAPVSYPAGININALAVGDVDHDGFPDVVAVGSSVAVLRNDGKGGLKPIVLNKEGLSTNLYPATGVQVALADIENNHQLDIVIADYSNSQLVVFRGNRLGYYIRTPTDFPACANPRGLAIADMNDDGNLDVVVTCVGSSAVAVLLGNGHGGFISTPYQAEIDPRAVTIADFNGDNQPDVAVVNGTSNTLNVLLEKTGVVKADHAPIAANNSLYIADGKFPLDQQMGAFDQGGNPLSYGIVTPSQGGTVSFEASSGVFQYQANVGFTGTDSFQFQVSDGVKLSNIATVKLTVAANTLGQSSSSSGGFLGTLDLSVLLMLFMLLLERRYQVAETRRRRS